MAVEVFCKMQSNAQCRGFLVVMLPASILKYLTKALIYKRVSTCNSQTTAKNYRGMNASKLILQDKNNSDTKTKQKYIY